MPDSQSRGPGLESPFSKSFGVCAFSFSLRRPSSLSCINEYLAIASGGNLGDSTSRVITAWQFIRFSIHGSATKGLK